MHPPAKKSKINDDTQVVCKIKFVDDKEVETYTITKDGAAWMVANPFAEALNYSKCANAIAKFVSPQNQKKFEEIRSPRFGDTDDSSCLPRNIQAKTKFINRAGVFELINASEMPAAKRFKAWNSNDLLPTLCTEGEYNMVKNAPMEINQGMNAVHAATTNGVEASWIKDLTELKQKIVEKDTIIAVKDEENKKLTVALQDANQNLIEANKGLLQAFNIINEARKETAQLANRMADIAQDVIAKPSDPQLLHSLAVCAMGGDQYAFVRPQKRSLKRSLDRLSVDEKDIVYRSDYVPNAMNVLNKVKEALPKEKYKARHNRITLLEDMTKEQLVDVIESTLTPRQVAIARSKTQ